MKDNNIVFDISKIQYAWRSWVTKDGNYKRFKKPLRPTVHGREFDEQAPAFEPAGSTNQPITMIEVAKARHLLDEWVPCTTLQVTANHRLTYTGSKAETIWKAWNERQFNKKK